MLRQIVPIEMDVAQIDGTWKLGQNKPEEVRVGAGNAVAESPIGAEVAALGELMLKPPC